MNKFVNEHVQIMLNEIVELKVSVEKVVNLL